MKRTMKILISLLAISFGLTVMSGQSQESAVVTGKVLDTQGNPVAGARISIFPTAAGSGGLPFAVTDQNGNYHLVSPPFGETFLCAVKESAGYPDTNGLLFSRQEDDRPKVTLSPGSHLQVDIHLGSPDGVLEGSVIDAVSRAKVPTAKITLRKTHPDAFYSGTITQSSFLFALPPTPIEISISAPGYMPWQYKDSQTGSNKILLDGTDHRTLTIELTPNNKN